MTPFGSHHQPDFLESAIASPPDFTGLEGSPACIGEGQFLQDDYPRGPAPQVAYAVRCTLPTRT